MFNSQALETAIGIAVMLFIFATASSAITEVLSAAMKKRATDLESALVGMLNSGDLPDGAKAVTPAEVQKIIKKAAGKARTSYLSAKSFADAVTELVAEGENIGGLQQKMQVLAREARGHLTAVKAGLETWFDETMATASDTYSKWATWINFGTGLVLAAVLNASVINVAHDLWVDTAARQAVVSAAGTAGSATAQCQADGSVLQQASCAIGDISSFQLPIGWSEHQRAGLSGGGSTEAWWWLSHIFGWLLTAVLVMLGAPFWFDLLGKLVNLRSSGPPPDPAPKDDASSSALLAKTAGRSAVEMPRVPSDDLVMRRMAARSRAQAAQGMQQEPTAVTVDDAQPADLVEPAGEDRSEVDWLATALNLPGPLAQGANEQRG